MKDINLIDYSVFDRDDILSFLFYPRKEGKTRNKANFVELSIPVGDDIMIGGRFYGAGSHAPLILFFHGNGEIAADYDDIAGLYNRLGISFMPVDYRGYGRSSGSPTVTGMMRDCHGIFEHVARYREQNKQAGPVIVMGRSLGSASALEIASNYSDRMDGLVIESGFAFIMPLLELLGVDVNIPGITENAYFGHIAKIGSYIKPTLIIHAERDHIIPYGDGLALYNASKSEHKKMLTIKNANHNNIYQLGLEEYMQAMREFVGSLK
jgi:fermentation-respiration switch protein FrsA (DUF1100 family)